MLFLQDRLNVYIRVLSDNPVSNQEIQFIKRFGYYKKAPYNTTVPIQYKAYD